MVKLSSPEDSYVLEGRVRGKIVLLKHRQVKHLDLNAIDYHWMQRSHLPRDFHLEIPTTLPFEMGV